MKIESNIPSLRNMLCNVWENRGVFMHEWLSKIASFGRKDPVVFVCALFSIGSKHFLLAPLVVLVVKPILVHYDVKSSPGLPYKYEYQ